MLLAPIRVEGMKERDLRGRERGLRVYETNAVVVSTARLSHSCYMLLAPRRVEGMVERNGTEGAGARV